MSDWTTDAADAIENAVALVRDRTVEPARTASKYVVYGLLAVLLVLPAVDPADHCGCSGRSPRSTRARCGPRG